jgi:hypothetical protein
MTRLMMDGKVLVLNQFQKMGNGVLIPLLHNREMAGCIFYWMKYGISQNEKVK